MGNFLVSLLASVFASLLLYVIIKIYKWYKTRSIRLPYKIDRYYFNITHNVENSTLIVEKTCKIKARTSFFNIEDFPAVSPEVADFNLDQYRVYVEDQSNVRRVFPSILEREPPHGLHTKRRSWFKINYDFTKGNRYSIATAAKYNNFQYSKIDSIEATSLAAMFNVPLYFNIKDARIDITLIINSQTRMNAQPYISRLSGEVRTNTLSLDRKHPMRNVYLGYLKKANHSNTYSLHYRWLIPNELLAEIDKEHLKKVERRYLDLPNKVTIDQGNGLKADEFLRKLFGYAEKEIIIVDNYLSQDFISKVHYLVGKGRIVFISRKAPDRLLDHMQALSKKREETGKGDIILSKEDYAHGRLVFVNRLIAYSSGASFKDLGNRLDYINKINDKDLKVRIDELVKKDLIPKDI